MGINHSLYLTIMHMLFISISLYGISLNNVACTLTAKSIHTLTLPYANNFFMPQPQSLTVIQTLNQYISPILFASRPHITPIHTLVSNIIPTLPSILRSVHIHGKYKLHSQNVDFISHSVPHTPVKPYHNHLPFHSGTLMTDSYVM